MSSNVHRVLRTLAHVGYVKKDLKSGRYVCTLKLWELGTLVAEQLDIRIVAWPHVRTLAIDTNETVHLTLLDGIEALSIDQIDSQHPVRAHVRLGGRAPAYCVATGKALLAYASESVLEDVFKSLVKITSRTITEPDAFYKELKKIRETGYAINRGEWRESINGLASPILNRHGHAIAAIGISGPNERLHLKRLREFSQRVVDAAQAIARDLGLSDTRNTRMA